MSDGPSPPPVAVALGYDGSATPTVVAKGRGEVAARILAVAEESGVAIERNAPLAEALARIELDDEIPEALYKAVAEVIAFVLRARDRMR